MKIISGIASRQINLEMPLGSQKESYCYRDVDGSVFHDAFTKSYGEKYTVGDIIGVLVHLSPPLPPTLKQTALLV
jgi:hypothetical protein